MNKQRIVILMVGVFLFAGGWVQATFTNWDIYSTTTIESGDFGTVNIYDTPPSQTIATMSGSSVEWFETYNNSLLIIEDGYVKFLHANDYSTIEMIGGTVGISVTLNDSSVMLLGGGQLNGYLAIVGANAKLYIHGQNFIYQRSGGYAESGHLTGSWLDGTEFNIYLRDLPKPFTQMLETNIFLVPEPLTLFLMLSGIIGIRKLNQ